MTLNYTEYDLHGRPIAKVIDRTIVVNQRDQMGRICEFIPSRFSSSDDNVENNSTS